MDPELTARLVEDRRPDDVGGEQVGSKLDPAEARVDRLCERAHHQCLGEPGQTLEEDVPSGQEPDKQPLHRLVLAHDPVVHSVVDLLQQCGSCGHRSLLHAHTSSLSCVRLPGPPRKAGYHRGYGRMAPVRVIWDKRRAPAGDTPAGALVLMAFAGPKPC